MSGRSRLLVVAGVVAGLLAFAGTASAEVTFTEQAQMDFGVDADGNPVGEPEGTLARAWRLFWLAPEGQRIFTFLDGIETEFVVDTRPEAEVGDGDAYGTAKVMERNDAGIPTRVRILVRNENVISGAFAADTIWHEFRHGEIFVSGDDDHEHDALDEEETELNEKFRADVKQVESTSTTVDPSPPTPHYDRIMEEARHEDALRRSAILLGDILEDIRDSISFNEPTYTEEFVDIEWYGSDKVEYTIQGVTATFNESTFECGERSPERIVVCADEVRPMPQEVVYSVTIVTDDVPLSGPDSLVYGAVFDSDRDPANDWVPVDPFDWDFFQGTDRWYELVYDHTADRWRLLVTQLNPDGTIPLARGTEPSSARVVVEGDTIVFFIGADEFPDSEPAVRQTAFGHDGFFSEEYRGGDVSGEDPTVPPNPIPADPVVLE